MTVCRTVRVVPFRTIAKKNEEEKNEEDKTRIVGVGFCVSVSTTSTTTRRMRRCSCTLLFLILGLVGPFFGHNNGNNYHSIISSQVDAWKFPSTFLRAGARILQRGGGGGGFNDNSNNPKDDPLRNDADQKDDREDRIPSLSSSSSSTEQEGTMSIASKNDGWQSPSSKLSSEQEEEIATSTSTEGGRSSGDSASAAAAVGLKSPRSNAVGDPDDDDDDDSDDDSDDVSELDSEDYEDWEALFGTSSSSSTGTTGGVDGSNDFTVEGTLDQGSARRRATGTVEVELEFVNGNAEEPTVQLVQDDDDDDDDLEEDEEVFGGDAAALISPTTNNPAPGAGRGAGGGGVGVRHRTSATAIANGGGGTVAAGKVVAATTTTSALDRNNETTTLVVDQQQRQEQQQQQAEILATATTHAWLPHIWWPPPSLEYLVDHATSMDASSRARLDRRTLYAGLLLEFSAAAPVSTTTSSSSNQTRSASHALGIGGGSTSRTYLSPPTSQALRSALSLATQPQWRQVLWSERQRVEEDNDDDDNDNPDLYGSGICLYDTRDDKNNNNRGTSSSSTSTLSMQETICCSLAHSLGAGMVILDDRVIASVRSQLLSQGFSEDQVKPAALLKYLLSSASASSAATLVPSTSQQKKRRHDDEASIAKAMQRDMDSLLDDPYDERALQSIEDMKAWEASWQQQNGEEEEDDSEPLQANDKTIKKRMPLVIFVRVSASTSLLKSKSAVEYLLRECSPPGSNRSNEGGDGIHLLVLGKGIVDSVATNDANDVVTAPPVSISSLLSNREQEQQGQPPSELEQRQQLQQRPRHPWFDFSPNNQHAMGQNDPPGSRRFNIFLARTVDADGKPGILGAVAPPQAGNLFPQMMALQARERLNRQLNGKRNSEDDDEDEEDENDYEKSHSPSREALERWARLLQQQQQQNQPRNNMAPQFFNATLSSSLRMPNSQDGDESQPPPPSVIQETLQHVLSEMLSKLALMSNEDKEVEDHDADSSDSGSSSNAHPPELRRAFAQVLQDENMRRGIVENLARAAPALSDPKCQGVMLSVYVPPPVVMNPQASQTVPPQPQQQQQQTREQLQQQMQRQRHEGLNQQMNGWFQRILNNQNQNGEGSSGNNNESNNKEETEKAKQRRVRTMAAAAAVAAANSAAEASSSRPASEKEREKRGEIRAARHLKRLEGICRPIVLSTPSDPVRARSWEGWVERELGAALFRWNRQALHRELEKRSLTLQTENLVEKRNGNQLQHSPRIGSALRSMLSVRDIASEMESVIRLAIEIEAETAQRKSLVVKPSMTTDSSSSSNQSVTVWEADPSLNQLVLPKKQTTVLTEEKEESGSLLLHPSTLELAISRICRITPSPYGGQFVCGEQVVGRVREECQGSVYLGPAFESLCGVY